MSALVVVTGAVPALARLVERIPPALTGALLAGVLLPFCLMPVRAAVREPLVALPLVAAWLVLSRLAPRAAGPVVIAAALVLTLLGRGGAPLSAPALLPTAPAIDPLAVLGLGVPLYLVTMAGQNLPGFAVLRLAGYPPPTRRVLVVAGAASMAAAPFGGVAVNLAALTGAIMTGPDAGADPARRWPSGVASGCVYLLLGLLAAPVAGIVGRQPPVLVEAAAGLALIGAFVGGLTSAFEDRTTRVPAAVALLVVASGVAVAGIGSPFWGLLAGGVALVLLRRPAPEPPTSAGSGG